MNTIFLSYHFDDEARKLADQLDNLIASHGLRTKTGAVLGGAGLTPEIQQRINDSDGVICLLTKRPDGRDNTWVMQELQYAATSQPPKKVVAIVEKGLDRPAGMLQGNASLSYDPDNRAQLFLDVSETLGLWRKQYGRDLCILLEPEDDHKDTATTDWSGENVTVQFRCIDSRGQRGDWADASLVQEEGGAVVYLLGVPVDRKVQVKMSGRNHTWESLFVSQSRTVEMMRKGAV